MAASATQNWLVLLLACSGSATPLAEDVAHDVRVTVVDTRGEPVSGARVAVACWRHGLGEFGPTFVEVVPTQDQKTFAASVRDCASVSAGAVAPGHVPHRAATPMAREMRLDLVLVETVLSVPSSPKRVNLVAHPGSPEDWHAGVDATLGVRVKHGACELHARNTTELAAITESMVRGRGSLYWPIQPPEGGYASSVELAPDVVGVYLRNSNGRSVRLAMTACQSNAELTSVSFTAIEGAGDDPGSPIHPAPSVAEYFVMGGGGAGEAYAAQRD